MSETMLWRLFHRGDLNCPLRNDTPDRVVFVGPDPVQLLRAGTPGSRYHLLLPESLRLSSRSFSIHGLYRKRSSCPHNGCRSLRQVPSCTELPLSSPQSPPAVFWRRQLEVVQYAVQPASKAADVEHKQADRYMILVVMGSTTGFSEHKWTCPFLREKRQFCPLARVTRSHFPGNGNDRQWRILV